MGQCCSSASSDVTDTLSNPDWMSKLPAHLHDVSLNHISIPGSHDSGSWFLDKNAPLGPDADEALKEACKIFGSPVKDIAYNWSKAQGLSFTMQLQAGIRYFDLRISTKPGIDSLYLVHGMYSVTLEACLSTINDYLGAHPQEVVLLDMNHFYGMNQQIHETCLKSITDIFGSKICPYLDSDSVTLNNLWQNKLQVIIFYHDQAAKDDLYFWPGDKIPSPWPNVTQSDKMIKTLDKNYAGGRADDTFYVTQGILTPDFTLIMLHLLSSLKTECSEKAAPPFVKWLKSKKSGPKGINVCIMDYVHLNEYIPTVLALNV